MIVPADILESGLRVSFTNDADWNAPIETGTLIFRARPLGFGFAPEKVMDDGVHMTCARVHGVRRNDIFIRPGFLMNSAAGVSTRGVDSKLFGRFFRECVAQLPQMEGVLPEVEWITYPQITQDDVAEDDPMGRGPSDGGQSTAGPDVPPQGTEGRPEVPYVAPASPVPPHPSAETGVEGGQGAGSGSSAASPPAPAVAPEGPQGAYSGSSAVSPPGPPPRPHRHRRRWRST